jgi:ATP-dependent exoDNAse (exonuclease V) alpha subunit
MSTSGTSLDRANHSRRRPQRAASDASRDRENLSGLVERVTFHNPDNGFCVLRVKARAQRELVTVVGHAPTISAGEFVQATGTWINDRTHGPQFKASFLRAAPPTTVEGIEKYLGSGMIRGIGPVYGKRLVRAFGQAVDVYNGDLGFVRTVDAEAGEVLVEFDGREVAYGFGELDELVLAYATTIHKSQGSEYPAVVIPLTTQHYPMLRRNLLYTGVTRGRRLVVIVGQRRAIGIAVRGVQSTRRWSKLREWLESSTPSARSTFLSNFGHGTRRG